MLIDSLPRSYQGVCVVFSVDAEFAAVWLTKPTAPSSSARGNSGPLVKSHLDTTGAWLWLWSCWACWRASSRVALSLSRASLRDETHAHAGSVSERRWHVYLMVRVVSRETIEAKHRQGQR